MTGCVLYPEPLEEFGQFVTLVIMYIASVGSWKQILKKKLCYDAKHFTNCGKQTLLIQGSGCVYTGYK